MSPGLCKFERREHCTYPKCECYASLRSTQSESASTAEAWWMVGDEYPPVVYTSRAEALSHGNKPVPLLRADLQLLADLCDWGISHKKSCPQPASNFQAHQPCKCGRDALLHRLRVAAGRSA